MMKSTLYSLLVCVLDGLAWAAESSEGDCLPVRDVCYQQFMLPRTKPDSWRFCHASGGRLAGEGYDFVEMMNTDPAMNNFLETRNCYWITWEESLKEKLGNWKRSSNTIAVFWGYLLGMFHGQKLCYKNEQWAPMFRWLWYEDNFVCEYDLPVIQVFRRRPTMKTRIFRKIKNSTLIVDGPLFNRKASLETLCSRVCFEFTGCSVFNYNTVSKECRGFQRGDKICTRHHPEWEFWALE